MKVINLAVSENNLAKTGKPATGLVQRTKDSCRKTLDLRLLYRGSTQSTETSISTAAAYEEKMSEIPVKTQKKL